MSPVTPVQRQLILDSFAQIAPRAEAVTIRFYTRMFELDPALRSLFREDMRAQARKVAATLNAALASLDRLGELLPTLRGMGVRHAVYGVRPQDYDTLGIALMDVLRDELGDAFTPEVEAAWAGVYNLMADAMRDAAASQSYRLGIGAPSSHQTAH